MYDWFEILLMFLYFAIPLGILAFWGISLYRYLSAKKANKKSPGTFSDDEFKRRKIIMIVTSCIAVTLTTVIVGFIGLMFLAVAFM